MFVDRTTNTFINLGKSELERLVVQAVADFGRTLTPRFAPGVVGEPEDKLRGPTETLLCNVATALGLAATVAGQPTVKQFAVRPDFAIYVNSQLTGHVELKAPGKGADPTSYKGHDKQQWQKASHFPNILYTDGNSWALFRRGVIVGTPALLAGDVRSSGYKLAPQNHSFARLLTNFLHWKPIPPHSAEELARTVAGLCRLLRDEVMEVLSAEASAPEDSRPFSQLADEWRNLLFPNASPIRFADSYAQTVTFALLLARSEGIDISDIGVAAQSLSKHHGLLGRGLQVLADQAVRDCVATSIGILQRVIGAVEWSILAPGKQETLPGFEGAAGMTDNPWLYFYEDFLANYDPALRKAEGAYYTPPAIVAAQVRLADDILQNRLGKKLGFASDSVVTLDPAMGAGSYLLRVIDQAVVTTAKQEGPGAVSGRLHSLCQRLVGFENMTGPYAVAELQVSAALGHHHVKTPIEGLRLYLTDTLADPYIEQTHLGGFYEPIAHSRRAANEVKTRTKVVVCLGNPPYDRHPVDPAAGGWVRHGNLQLDQEPILDAFRASDIPPGHLTNLYNLYVYFWRWALWKVFEAHPDLPGGVVTFITSSSFLNGPGFAEMRAHMRRIADYIWIIDLGGEGRGPRREENVFAIQTPVAITICARTGDPNPDSPASARYLRLSGTKKKKLGALRELKSVNGVAWRDVPTGWRDPLIGRPPPAWEALPLIFDLIPSFPGCQVRRTWPIDPSPAILKKRWRLLSTLDPKERPRFFRVDVHRNTTSRPTPLPNTPKPVPETIAEIDDTTPVPPLVRYAYRSFDQQWLIADARLITTPTPELWAIHSDKQVFLTTQRRFPLGNGPAVTATAHIPDYDHFHGSFGGAVLPLWRDASASKPNIAPSVLKYLETLYDAPVTGPDFFAYITALLAHSGYTQRYYDELSIPGPRVPITCDRDKFFSAAALGRELLWLHTQGHCFPDETAGRPRGVIPTGQARMTKPIPADPSAMPNKYSYDFASHTLTIGDGQFAPVAPEVWTYEVSAMNVLSKWLGYRMHDRRGKKSSPLNDIVTNSWPAEWTTELLQLLWILERVVALESSQAEILAQVTRGRLVTVKDLRLKGAPKPAPSRRRAGHTPRNQATLPDVEQ